MSNRRKIHGIRRAGRDEWLTAIQQAGLPDGERAVATAIAAVADSGGRWNTDDLEDHLGLERGSLRDA
jgi:hypothetical protein